MTQEKIFVQSEADAWFKRNKDSLESLSMNDDKIFNAIKSFFPNLEHKKILEVGCSNGYRLNWLKCQLNAEVFGIEPSLAAFHDCQLKNYLSPEEIAVETASRFFLKNENKFDIIIFGHCLYLLDPELYSNIVHGAMSALKQNGYIFIYDFESTPQKEKYHHKDGIFSYKMSFSKLFTWHPQYKIISKFVESHGGGLSYGNLKEDCSLTIIRKIDKKYAFPTLLGDIKI